METKNTEDLLKKSDQLKQKGKRNQKKFSRLIALIEKLSEKDQIKLKNFIKNKFRKQGISAESITTNTDFNTFVKHPNFFNYLGDFFKIEKDYLKAIKFYKKALDINSRNYWANFHLAEIYSQHIYKDKTSELGIESQVFISKTTYKAQYLGNYELALGYIQQAIEQNPSIKKKRLCYVLIEKILRELGKLEEANKFYYHLGKTTPEIWEEEYSIKLRIGHIRNSILIPLVNTSPLPPLQGGIKTNENCPPYFYHLRQNFFGSKTDINYLEKQDHQPSIKLHGTYLYAGFAFSHFGHYMAECTHRFWAYSKLSSQINGVVILPEFNKNNPQGYRKLSPFMEQAITYMQIPLESIYLVSEVTEVEHLIVPEQASTLHNNFKLSGRYLDFLSENEEKFFHTYKSQKSAYPKKLYVSRSHLIHKGAIAGEAYIENLLQKHENFYILKPENYSLHEQMNFYRHAKVCIFSEGSAIHGLELLGWLNKMSTVAIIFRRPDSPQVNTLPQIIASRIQNSINFCQFKATKIIHPLKQNLEKKPKIVDAVSIFSNIDLLLQFFRDNEVAQLNNFDLNDFYRQEAIDIFRYVMQIKPNTNNFSSDSDFVAYFHQFTHDLRQFSQNPYFKQETLSK